MNKFEEIRPIVLGLAIKDNKLLVSEGFDKIKNQTFMLNHFKNGQAVKANS